ncbi:hypothetical protein, partial [Acinetobacter oleivorans]|uniref:hypothetical protein n=1 Tax=Acinetobacter oleivorans TaxID=1148157 RepID=UPI001C06B029
MVVDKSPLPSESWGLFFFMAFSLDEVILFNIFYCLNSFCCAITKNSNYLLLYYNILKFNLWCSNGSKE